MAKKKKSKESTQSDSRQKALKNVIDQIESQYGTGAIMQMDEHQYARIEGIPTGSLSLDLALGGRGIPRGRVTELYGPESSGKTTLALHTVAQAQKKGGVAAFIDAEHALDTTWAKRLGVDVSNLLVSQPGTGEEALEIAEMLVRSNSVDIIVVDSVAALTPKAEIEGEMGDSHVGLQARLMSQAMRKLSAIIHKSKTSLIFINQIRMKIGVMFGNPETTPGGRALKFYSSVRVDIRRIGGIKEDGKQLGNHVRAKVVKNKIAPPFQKAEFDIMFDSGISYTGDLLDLSVQEGLVKKAGAWFKCGDVKLGQGREKSKAYLDENPELAKELEQKILAGKGLIEQPEKDDKESKKEKEES
jgi:recombination protein RecA